MHTNDIVEALSLRAGINIPTRRFALYMSAEQEPQQDVSIETDGNRVSRDWELGEDFLNAARAAIERLLGELAPITERHTVFADWPDTIETAAHHSGTCRMAISAETGVCDRDGRVFGTTNLFICDGSLLPSTGSANTGLTIGALAFRLAETVLADVVISGAGGFIGGHLAAAFTARGIAVADYRAFRDGRDVADTFIHCANVHDSPAENARYTADVLATVGSRAKRFIQLQTFATLHGLGRLDAGTFNFGKTPLLMAPYPLGKLLQEKVLCAHAQRHPTLAIRLLYLPAVLGGGSWAKVIATAQRNGVLLPPLMHATARANHIDVGDIAAHLLAAGTRLRAGHHPRDPK